MNSLRPLILIAVAATLGLAPQMPSQASELVKLGRLIVTGKRTVSPLPAEEAKGPLAARPSGEAVDRPAANARAAEPVAEAAAVNANPSAAQTDRPSTEHNGKASLDRTGAGGGGTVSADGAAERAVPFFSLKGLLRAL